MGLLRGSLLLSFPQFLFIRGVEMKIEVRKDGQLVETVERKPFNKGPFGNFVPHYVRYKTQVYLLKGGIDYAYMHSMPDILWISI